jgi:trigger factor
MQVSVTDLGSCEKQIAVVVPANEVDAEIDQALEKVRGQIALPGFRPGRVPKALVEKRFGGEIRADVSAELCERALDQAVRDHKLEVISAAEIDAAPQPETGKDLAFTMRVEVKPEFELPNYKGLAITRTVQPVVDADVDAVIEDLRKRHSVFRVVHDDEGFAAGDFAFGPIAVLKDGEVLHELEEGRIGGPNPGLVGFQTPGLAAALLGKKSGDVVEVEGTRSSDDAPILVRVTVRDVKRRELPVVDDAFAVEAGEQTLLGLRVAIRKELEHKRKHEADDALNEGLVDQIAAQTTFDLARRQIERTVDGRVEYMTRMLHMAGETEEKARVQAEGERDRIRKSVERDARAWLIVEKVAKKEKLFALEDDVAKEINKIAESRGMTPTEVREEIEREEGLPGIRASILERKVLEFLRAHAKVTDAGAAQAAGAGGAEGA